jgi:hypothetical protein
MAPLPVVGRGQRQERHMKIEISETTLADTISGAQLTTLINRFIQHKGAGALGTIVYEALVTRERHVEFLQKFTDRMPAAPVVEGIAGMSPGYNKDLIRLLQERVDAYGKPETYAPPLSEGTQEEKWGGLRLRFVKDHATHSNVAAFAKEGWRLLKLQEALSMQKPISELLPGFGGLRNWVWLESGPNSVSPSNAAVVFNPEKKGADAVCVGDTGLSGALILVKEA